MTGRRFQSLIGLILVVSLTAMGFAAATARGQTAAGGQVVVLCPDGGLVQVRLDAEGNPTGESQLCPDLACSLLAAAAVAAPEVTRPDAPAEALAPGPAHHRSFPVRAASRARSPPVAA